MSTKLTTIVVVALATIFMAIMAQKAVASLSDYADSFSSAQQTLLDANM